MCNKEKEKEFGMLDEDEMRENLMGEPGMTAEELEEIMISARNFFKD